MNFFGYGILLLVKCLFLVLTTAESDDFVNEWVVNLQGGEQKASEIARTHGYRLIRALKGFEDHYLFKRDDTPHRSKRSADHHTQKLVADESVHFVQQQRLIIRQKRRPNYNRDIASKFALRGRVFNDPSYRDEWYIYKKPNQNDPGISHMGIVEAWKKGYSGKGVKVVVLDDGIEKDHPDLVLNYDPHCSYDFNDDDDDPSPRYDFSDENKHGTRCAGEIAMLANNGQCGTGIAFNAKIGGVRMLDGSVTDRLEGEALGFNIDYIDIFSSSWGPTDDGNHCEGPGTMASQAFLDGTTKGRDGKGVIYVWASGNGGSSYDNCNADGYTLRRETISVSSVSQFGSSPWYAEKCSSTMTTTYSSGSTEEGKVISTDLHHKCTKEHTGTSASAPMAAGILALALEANQNLTWRDMQHAVVHTSDMSPLSGEKGWYRNGAGYCVNLAFGFGILNADALVTIVNEKVWETVGEEHVCEVQAKPHSGLPLPFATGEEIVVKFRVTDQCKRKGQEVNFLEHVQVVVDIEHTRRGNIYAEIISPSGTKTVLMALRKNDNSQAGMRNWPFMSVHTWGEDPAGDWTFKLADVNENPNSSEKSSGTLNSIKLVLYGTEEQPPYQKDSPKNCNLNDTERNSKMTKSVSRVKKVKLPSRTEEYKSILTSLGDLENIF